MHMVGQYSLVVSTRSILSEDESERVRTFLRRRLQREHGGNVTALARELGIPQPRMSRTLNERHGVSLDTARALARIEGLNVQSVLRDPRELAAELAREAGVPEDAVRRVLTEPEDDPPRAALWYIDRMRAFAALVGGGGSGTFPVAGQGSHRSSAA
jgi:hypothetical protein